MCCSSRGVSCVVSCVVSFSVPSRLVSSSCGSSSRPCVSFALIFVRFVWGAVLPCSSLVCVSSVVAVLSLCSRCRPVLLAARPSFYSCPIIGSLRSHCVPVLSHLIHEAKKKRKGRRRNKTRRHDGTKEQDEERDDGTGTATEDKQANETRRTTRRRNTRRGNETKGIDNDGTRTKDKQATRRNDETRDETPLMKKRKDNGDEDDKTVPFF